LPCFFAIRDPARTRALATRGGDDSGRFLLEKAWRQGLDLSSSYESATGLPLITRVPKTRFGSGADLAVTEASQPLVELAGGSRALSSRSEPPAPPKGKRSRSAGSWSHAPRS
jgi:hypothetical protein